MGSNSTISSRNKTGVTLPDYIIADWAGDSAILRLTLINDDSICHEATSGGTHLLKKFHNNQTSNDYGTPDAYLPNTGSYQLSTWDATASLKDYVDANKAVSL